MEKRKWEVKKKLGNVQKAYRPWDEYSVGDVLVGKYIGTHVDQYDKKCPIIELEETFFKKSLPEGTKNLVLNNNGAINAAFYDEEKPLEEGVMVQVSYDGMEKMEGGPYKGKDKHLVQVDLVEAVEDDVEL